MHSRMEKYFENENDNTVQAWSRTKKNQKLYKEVSSLELEDFDLNSNVSILGDNSSSINIDDIKEILDKKYHEKPRKKSFGDTDQIETKLNLDETREYDINSILEKAKEEKEVNYEEERLKKIRNTQYDILKSLDIMNDDEEVEETTPKVSNKYIKAKETKEESERKLKELIDTITAKELIRRDDDLTSSSELDPLDILSDLKGEDENTRVMGMLAEELKWADEENRNALNDSTTLEKVDDDIAAEEELEDTLGIENPNDSIDEKSDDVSSSTLTEEEMIRKTVALKEFDKELEEEMRRREEESKKKKEQKISSLENTASFTTNTMSFTQSDFDDFIDLKEDMQITKVIVKILIVIIIVVFIIGVVVLANNFLGLGLF